MNLTTVCDDLDMTSIPGPVDGWRSEGRAEIDAVFDGATRTESSHHPSPSGRYDLEIVTWETPDGWDFSEGIVRSNDEPLSVIRRNYGIFPFTWCEDHPAGHDYLIAGEDYQGQTVIELDTGQRRDHLPDDARSGGGFCWAQHHVAPDKTTLVVDGCFWACPYELVAYDFTRPLELPYAELHRWPGELCDVQGFDEQGSLRWTFTRGVRASDGKPEEGLTQLEVDGLLDADGRYRPGALGTQTYRAQWRHGEPFASTQIVPLDTAAP
jgi:hypothetical protein